MAGEIRGIRLSLGRQLRDLFDVGPRRLAPPFVTFARKIRLAATAASSTSGTSARTATSARGIPEHDHEEQTQRDQQNNSRDRGNLCPATLSMIPMRAR